MLEDEARIADLFTAAQCGDAETVRALLEAGGDPSAIAPDDTSPLQHAVWRGHMEVTRLLVEAGARFPRKSPYFDSALTYAIGQQHLALVPILLRRVGDYSPEEINRAFFDAAHSGTPNELTLLHAAGASVEGDSGWEWTPLLVSLSRPENAAWLLGHGANPNFVSRNGRKERALHLAARQAYQMVRTVRLLLDAGAYPDPTDSYRHTPLMNAAYGHRQTPGGSLADRFAIAKMLVERGANVNAAALDGLTPLLGALKTGNEELALYLLEQGAMTHVQTRSGLTPLIAAVLGGLTGMASRFLADGADVNTRTRTGKTPLLTAAGKGDTAMVALLLAHSADASLADNKGVTAQSIARRNKQTAIMALLGA